MSHSPTGGVLPFPIGGRMVKERERCIGMTEDERVWRAKYLKDQILSKNEPRHVPEYFREIRNPIRRFYMMPTRALEAAVLPIVGTTAATHIRFWTGKLALAITALYCGAYYFKYHQNDWTRKKGWRVIKSRPACVPGDEGYPKASDRTKPSDYAARGFKEAKI